MTSATHDRTRQWVLAGRIGLVAILTAVVTLDLVGVGFWIVLPAVAPLVVAGGWLRNPRRSWWGTGPLALVTDPVRHAAWRRSEIRFAIIAFVVVLAIVQTVTALTGIAVRRL